MAPKFTPAMVAAMLDALDNITRGGHVSNTVAGKLAKLGWVRIRETKVYDATGSHKLFDVRITAAGRAELQASRT